MDRLRLCFVIAAVATVAGCSFGPEVAPLKYVSPRFPTPACALQGAYQAAAEEKLTGLVEISDVRQGRSFGPGAFMLCLRSSGSDASPVRTYSVFFNSDQYVGVRSSVIMDDCEKQAFRLLTPPPKRSDKDKSKDNTPAKQSRDKPTCKPFSYEVDTAAAKPAPGPLSLHDGVHQ